MHAFIRKDLCGIGPHDIPRHPTTQRPDARAEQVKRVAFSLGHPAPISRWLKHDKIASHKKHFLQQFWTLTTAGLSEMEIFKGHFQRSISTLTRGRDGDMLAAACSTGSARECDVLPENLAINVVWNTNLGKCGMILYDFMYYS